MGRDDGYIGLLPPPHFHPHHIQTPLIIRRAQMALISRGATWDQTTVATGQLPPPHPSRPRLAQITSDPPKISAWRRWLVSRGHEGSRRLRRTASTTAPASPKSYPNPPTVPAGCGWLVSHVHETTRSDSGWMRPIPQQRPSRPCLTLIISKLNSLNLTAGRRWLVSHSHGIRRRLHRTLGQKSEERGGRGKRGFPATDASLCRGRQRTCSGEAGGWRGGQWRRLRHQPGGGAIAVEGYT